MLSAIAAPIAGTLFGKGAGNGGECSQQSLVGYPDRGESAKIDARRATRAQGVFTCRVCLALDPLE